MKNKEYTKVQDDLSRERTKIVADSTKMLRNFDRKIQRTVSRVSEVKGVSAEICDKYIIGEGKIKTSKR